MKKKLLFGSLSILIVLAIFLGACSKTTTPEPTTTTPEPTTTTPEPTTTTPEPTPAPLKTLKIGSLLSLNNPQFIQGKKWSDLYAKLVNDAGGWKIGDDTYKIEFIIYDTQSGPAAAKDALTKLVLQDGVKFVLGGTGSPAVDMTVTEPNHVIVIDNDLTNDATMPNVQYYYTTGNFFASALVYKICKDMSDKGVKSYVSVKPDSQMGRFFDPQINAAWNIASKGSVKKLETIFVDPSTVDFGPVATKVLSYNPDCVDMIYLGMIPNSVPNMYRALADAGYKGTVLPGIASVNDVANLATMVGKEFIEGGEVFSQDPTGYQKDPRMLSLLDAYVKEYGELDMDNTAALGGMLLLEDAINATQSVDVEVIKAYLDHMDHAVRTTTGFVQLFARPDLNNFRTTSGGNSHPVARITDGVLKNFSQVTMKDQYLFSIIANNLVDIYKAYWTEYGYPKFPAEEEAASSLHFSDLGITGQD